jgi:dihydrofolate reductase
MNISLDGCYDHTITDGDDELLDHFTAEMQDVDLIVYGRKMYELIVPYWTEVAEKQSDTKAGNAFAQTVVDPDKIVVSRTLESTVGNTRIIRGNPEEEIRRLKQQPGKNISVAGMSLYEQLSAAGLIDEYHFLIHPVIIGKGEKLIANHLLPEKLKLNLADTRVLKSGRVAVYYVKQ